MRLFLCIACVLFSGCTVQKVIEFGDNDSSKEFVHSDFDKTFKDDSKNPKTKKSGLTWVDPAAERIDCYENSTTPYSVLNKAECR